MITTIRPLPSVVFLSKALLSRALRSIALLALVVTGLGHAQSVTILANNSDAQECYFNARQVIASPHSASIWTPAPCDRALASAASLMKRDLIAVHINRGIIFAAHEDYQSAFADYKKAYDLNPDQPEAHVNLGNLYFLTNNLTKADEFYTRALDLGLDKAQVAHLNRGMVRELLGALDQAEEDYRQAIAISPEWPLPKKKLQRVLNKQGKRGV